ncbi:hypothetical protein L596_013957 [Steinernema carpocapsae]|uniref:Uncharacterized protein n=1 Tax=Steinernema carpocapsae TaxID=34508 RepID=A0A4U5NB64_STECR|nr:hypothetical protein L596_013957 [Steinernema carpocapsae]
MNEEQKKEHRVYCPGDGSLQEAWDDITQGSKMLFVSETDEQVFKRLHLNINTNVSRVPLYYIIALKPYVCSTHVQLQILSQFQINCVTNSELFCERLRLPFIIMCFTISRLTLEVGVC